MNEALMTFIGVIVFLILSLVLFFFITNKTKYGKIISKVFILAIIVIAFYKIFNGGLEKIDLGIINGAVILGLTWGMMFAARSRHFFNTIEILFVSCIAGWIFSFGIACLEFGNIPFATSMRIVSLIGLGLSAISVISSSGELFSLNKSNYVEYFSGPSPTRKKIKATTYDYGLFKETTYRDENGNETKVEHWKL